MKNKLRDLNDHLFAQIERLGDEDLKGDELKKEIERAEAITRVSDQIISNASLVLKAQIFSKSGNELKRELPAMLSND